MTPLVARGSAHSPYGLPRRPRPRPRPGGQEEPEREKEPGPVFGSGDDRQAHPEEGEEEEGQDEKNRANGHRRSFSARYRVVGGRASQRHTHPSSKHTRPQPLAQGRTIPPPASDTSWARKHSRARTKQRMARV